MTETVQKRETVNADGSVTIEVTTAKVVRETWSQWVEWGGGRIPDNVRCWLPIGVQVKYRGIMLTHPAPEAPELWAHGANRRVPGYPHILWNPSPDADIVAYRMRVR